MWTYASKLWVNEKTVAVKNSCVRSQMSGAVRTRVERKASDPATTKVARERASSKGTITKTVRSKNKSGVKFCHIYYLWIKLAWWDFCYTIQLLKPFRLKLWILHSDSENTYEVQNPTKTNSSITLKQYFKSNLGTFLQNFDQIFCLLTCIKWYRT